MPANGGRVEVEGGDAALRASVAGPTDPPAVGAGETVRVLVDVSLGAAAPSAAIVLVGPHRPSGGRGLRRSLVPGETRQVVVEVAIPASTPPGVRRIVVRATATDGTVAEAGVEVAILGDGIPSPAPAPVAPPEPVAAPVEVTIPAEPVTARRGPERTPAHRAAPPPPTRSMVPAAVAVLVVVVVAVVAAVAYAVVRDDGDAPPDARPAATAPTAPGPGATGTVPGGEQEEAPDLGRTFAVTGTVELDDVDPATVLVSVGVAAEGGTATVTSTVDADGRYELALPEGIHRIVVTAPGFRETPQTVVVEQGPVDVAPITLIPA